MVLLVKIVFQLIMFGCERLQPTVKGVYLEIYVIHASPLLPVGFLCGLCCLLQLLLSLSEIHHETGSPRAHLYVSEDCAHNRDHLLYFLIFRWSLMLVLGE